MNRKIKLFSLDIFVLVNSLLMVNNFKSNNIYKDTTQSEIPSQYCLRDDYFTTVQNQTHTGLCWDYAASLALTTTLEKATNEFNDYSEVWTSICYSKMGSYVPNAGGTFSNFQNATNTYGLLYECDLQAEKAWLTPKTDNTNIIDFYGRNANKITSKNLVKATYSLKTQKDKVKQHIMNNGGLHIAATWKTTSMLETTNGRTLYCKVPNEPSVSGAHAVCLVGWDDNLSVNYNDKLYTGAWIVQNSFGEREDDQHGATYLFYDDPQIWSSAEGYTYVDKTSTSVGINFTDKVEESNSVVVNSHSGHFYGDFTDKDEETKQKNVFFRNNDIFLKYSYNLSANTSIRNIKIYNSSIDVSNLFSINLDEVNKKFTIKSKEGKELDFGTYVIKIELKNGSAIDYYYNSIYLLTGAEINTIEMVETNDHNIGSVRADIIGDRLNDFEMVENNGYYFLFNSYNYSKDYRNIEISTCYPSGYFKFMFYNSMYNDFDYIEINGVKTYEFNNNKNYFTINYDGLNEANKKTTIPVKLVSKQGNVNSFDVIIEFAAKTDKYAYIRSNNDGALNTNQYKILFNDQTNIELEPIEKEGFRFDGWYYDKEYSHPLEIINGKYIYDKTKLINYGQQDNSSLYSYYYYRLNYINTDIGYIYAKFTYDPVLNKEVELSSQSSTIGDTITISSLDNSNYTILYSLYVDNELISENINGQFDFTFIDNEEHDIRIDKNISYYDNHKTVAGNTIKIRAIIEPANNPEKNTAAIIASISATIIAVSTLIFIFIKKRTLKLKK